MKKRLYPLFIWGILFILVVSMACSLTTTVKPATPTPAPTDTQVVKPQDTVAPTEKPVQVTSAAPGAVSGLDNVQKAVIQIQSEGTFVDPQVGLMVNSAGRGSGFIIDPSGLAITNNHVVTGAALLKVWVGGDTSKQYNARVLGVSECSDLAVIKLDGSDFPYLQWADTAPKVGVDVYAAGFPLGDPTYSMTKGIISKASTNGDSSWASVNAVIEHDAKLLPGNSGGPLVDAQGNVVAINYAGNSEGQSFAIAKAEAMTVIDQLKAGNNDTFIGVNGEAVKSSDGSIAGVWVSSVKSGSPADKAGVQAGDIITQLESFALAQDGTMADYCRILREHTATDTLAITVLRYATSEVLTGELNGRALKVTASFAQSLSGQVNNGGAGTSGGATGDTYSGYVTVEDDLKQITVDIPKEWSQVDGSPWKDTWTINGVDHPFSAADITASANLDNFNKTFDESGVHFAASSDWGAVGGYENLLDAVKSNYESGCTQDGSYQPYSDDLYEGKYVFFKDCGSNNTEALILAARPKSAPTAYLVLVEEMITTKADLDALDHILATFKVK